MDSWKLVGAAGSGLIPCAALCGAQRPFRQFEDGEYRSFELPPDWNDKYEWVLWTQDYPGNVEWKVFAESVQRVFPDRSIVEIEDKEPIFHTVYDLNDRFQIPGSAARTTAKGAHWRAICDDQGRTMITISVNSDLGDAWEHADYPEYPTRFSGLASRRMGVNYAVYAMTH